MIARFQTDSKQDLIYHLEIMFSVMNNIIITFAIFSSAAALPDNYYGAPTDSPMLPPPAPTQPQPPQPPTVAPPPQPPTIAPPPQPPTVAPPPQPTTTTTLAPPPEPTTSEPTTEDLIQVLTKKGNFKQLIEAITKSGLTDQLKTITTGLATIFAPNDNAFEKLPEGTTIESLTKKDLEKIISR